MRSVFRALVTACALGAAAVPASALEADAPTVEELVTLVEGVYGPVQSIRADFVQVSRSASLGEEQRQKGRVLLKRPRKMRWEFTSPDTKLFVTDGQTMWIWSPADNQVIVYKDFSGNAEGVASLLSDLQQLDERFEVTLVDEEIARQRGVYILDLKPRQEPANFRSLRVSLDRRKLVVQGVAITDSLGNVTDLAFSQVHLDSKVNDGDFTFRVPAGAQVIAPDGP
ncbi:MAG: outer membrane lipoprotein carrier protein LolA [Deltaproteobacteria bacterium]|nr:outer membrane lipoprotein carrier protein LolA [Deltaproteobacteria bacterium]